MGLTNTARRRTLKKLAFPIGGAPPWFRQAIACLGNAGQFLQRAGPRLFGKMATHAISSRARRRSARGDSDMLILFYDTMWGAPLHLPAMIEGTEFSTERQRYGEADAVVFHLPEWPFGHVPSGRTGEAPPKKRPGQLWIAWSLECEQHYPLMSDPHFMQAFDLTMTYKRNADIRLNYAVPHGGVNAMTESFRRRSPARRENALLASFISSRFDRSGRRAYQEELARHLAIDSYGKFMRNRILSPDLGRRSKLETLSSYKFTIAFENARAEDYVTEKFFDPLWAGSVPLYLGAPNVEAFAPGDRCFIDVSAFPDPRSLANYLLELARDDEAYESYFAWKAKPFRPTFESLLADHATSWLARLNDRVKERIS